MELFYKFVLQYEDGHAVFEWGAGGIMHLHSINWGSQMPRINPEKLAEGKCSDWNTSKQGAACAQAHEEYLTDWSWTKKEMWVFQEVDNKKAVPAQAGSPVHTDSESDGSVDVEGGGDLDVARDIVQHGDVFQQHVLDDDEDFVRLFPTATSMQYAMTAAGTRQRVRLSRKQLRTLEALNAHCADDGWHPCQVTVQQKALLMTNNCRLVRRARRKWYRRLTQKCNMHDRHGGLPTAVFVEAADTDAVASVCVDDAPMKVVVDRTTEAVVLRVGTLNLNLLDLAPQVAELLDALDVLRLQEVTPTCLEDLLQVSEQKGFDAISPLHRGVTAPEGFDDVRCLHVVEAPHGAKVARECDGLGR